MSYFLGVDGGNTKTLAIVADGQGRIVGTGRAGNGDIYGAASPDAAMSALTSAVEAAFKSAGIGAKDVQFGGHSIAGADWPEDYDFIASHVAAYADKTLVVNDSIGALRSGTKDGTGVAVICGTYGTCGAQSGSGKRWCGGFWHRAEGGGMTLGRSAWNAVVDAELGIGEPTSMTDPVLRHYGGASVEELLHRFSRRAGEGHPSVDRLVPILFSAADAGDPAAQAVVSAHGVRAGHYAVAAAVQVGLEDGFPLVLTGGVMRSQPNPLRDVIVRTVLDRFPRAVPTSPQFQPVVGALMLAYDSAGVSVDASVEANLKETDPGPAFYQS